MPDIKTVSIPNIKMPSISKTTKAPTMKQLPQMKFTPDVISNSMKKLQNKDIPGFDYLKSLEKQAISGIAVGKFIGKGIGKAMLKGQKVWRWSKLHPAKAALGGTAVLSTPLILRKKKKRKT